MGMILRALSPEPKRFLIQKATKTVKRLGSLIRKANLDDPVLNSHRDWDLGYIALYGDLKSSHPPSLPAKRQMITTFC